MVDKQEHMMTSRLAPSWGKWDAVENSRFMALTNPDQDQPALRLYHEDIHMSSS
jgi:hypothetical protein